MTEIMSPHENLNMHATIFTTICDFQCLISYQISDKDTSISVNMHISYLVKSQSSGKSSLFYSYASIDIKASTQMTFYCFSFKCVTWVGIDFKFEGYCIKTECMASIYVVEIGADFTLCWCSA